MKPQKMHQKIRTQQRNSILTMLRKMHRMPKKMTILLRSGSMKALVMTG